MNIILYTTNCPKCNVLKTKLIQKGIDFTVCDDINVMEEKGFLSAPMLEVNNEIMDFKQAIDWVNSKE